MQQKQEGYAMWILITHSVIVFPQVKHQAVISTEADKIGFDTVHRTSSVNRCTEVPSKPLLQ